MNTQSNPNFLPLMVGVIMLFVFGSQLMGPFIEPDDHWWTPESMMLSFDESRGKTEVFIEGQRLEDVLDNGDLLIVRETETVALTMDDLEFRFNNYNEVMASKLPSVAIDSSCTTIGVILIIIGLIPLFRKHGVDGVSGGSTIEVKR